MMEENTNKGMKPVRRTKKETKNADGMNLVTVVQLVLCLLLGLSFFWMSKTSQSEAFKSDLSKLMSWESFKSDASSVMGYVKDYLAEPVEFFPVFGSKKDQTESNAEQTTAENETNEVSESESGSETAPETQAGTRQEDSVSLTEKISAGQKTVSLVKTDLDYQSQDDTAKIVSPVSSTRYTSKFGYRINPITNTKAFHTGLDIAAPLGTKIKAAYNGTVSKTGEDSHSGKYIFLSHANGLETFYCHCSQIVAQEGAKIRQGETIALVGSTGWSTGPHLHFEIHKDGKRLDPLAFLES